MDSVALGTTRVTISGPHLASASSVSFGGTAARIVSNTDSELVVTACAHVPGPVDIVLVVASNVKIAERTTMLLGYRFGHPNRKINRSFPRSEEEIGVRSVHSFAYQGSGKSPSLDSLPHPDSAVSPILESLR
ncbi:hypothetical protein J2798_001789 [Herbaspirillum seropedicae]|nr:hypothetical protein [Herbaspirillum seropedicae]